MSLPQQNPPPISLLCVDDDVAVLDTLALFFRRQPDFAVRTSSSAIDARNLLDSQHFDAIICDYSMPDMDGITLLRELRSRGNNAIFITLTGRHLTKVAIDTLNSGGNYYVQKGEQIANDLQTLAGLIRQQKKNVKDSDRPQPVVNPFQALIDEKCSPICFFEKNGRFRYTNRSCDREIGTNEPGNAGFFSVIPDDERDELARHLATLTGQDPSAHILHHIRSQDGTLKLFLGNYRVIADDSGTITGYSVQGSPLSGIICLSRLELHSLALPKIKPEPVIQKVSLPEPERPVRRKPRKKMKDYFAELAGSVERVQYPVFAIDRAGKVIVWNKAMAALTGIEAAEIYGEGNHAHAVAMYGDSRPMLVDYICDQHADKKLRTPPEISHDGNVFNRDHEQVTLRGIPMLLWSKGTGIYDTEGTMIAAVQSILARPEQPEKKAAATPAEETYIGGISSIILKVTGMGVGGAIAGALGSAVGGYGVYATNQRLIVIRNPDLDATRDDSIQFGTFILGELFGTNVDTRPLSLDELEQHKVHEVWRKDITRIELKRPMLLAGSLVINTVSGATFRVYIDHAKAFTHLEHLLRLFYPEVLSIE